MVHSDQSSTLELADDQRIFGASEAGIGRTVEVFQEIYVHFSDRSWAPNQGILELAVTSGSGEN
jgi:hypothetical protein